MSSSSTSTRSNTSASSSTSTTSNDHHDLHHNSSLNIRGQDHNPSNIHRRTHPWELNPFFPLHKDILLAATRELLILDGSLNPKTLEVLVPKIEEEMDMNMKLEMDMDMEQMQPQEEGVEKISQNHNRHVNSTDKSIVTTVNATTNENTGKKNHIIVVGKCIVGNNHNHQDKSLTTKKDGSNRSSSSTSSSCVTTIASNLPKRKVKRKRSDSTTAAGNKVITKISDTSTSIPFIQYLSQHKKVKLGKHGSQPSNNPNTIMLNSSTRTRSNANASGVVLNRRALKNNDNHKEKVEVTRCISNNEIISPVHVPSTSLSSQLLNETTTLQGEDLANIILQQCVWDLDHCDDDKDDNVPSFIRLSSSSSSSTNTITTTATASDNEQQQQQLNKNFTYTSRPRKVSDVDDFTFVSTTSCPLSSDISPHLAVVAMNYQDEPGQDVLHSVKKQLLTGGSSGDDNHYYYHNNNKNIRNVSNQEEILLEVRNNLPHLLDVSIMVEAHLRRTAYQMIQRLTSHFDEKTNREFLGYKSSSLKKDRILLLMSDFLFDVSHAMFAWDQTEAETFGTDSYTDARRGNHHTTLSSALDGKSLILRDKKVCDILFDSKALRKIGGFDPSSLLYHAVSIQRLRAKKETWVDLAKTSNGKKMLRHHFDNQARVQVGQIRRGQRIRKSRSVFHPVSTTATTTTSNEKGLKSRSRSSSIASDENDLKNVSDCHSLNDIVEDDSNSMQIQNIIPDSLSITVSRQDTSKSWGILLAKEGSMCMVMRVPNEKSEKSDETCPNTTLQRGDLIVSFRNERNEIFIPSQHNVRASSDWFSEVVSLFRRSCTLYLNVRRVTCSSKSH